MATFKEEHQLVFQTLVQLSARFKMETGVARDSWPAGNKNIFEMVALIFLHQFD